jgi:hypothetical protein
VGDLPAERRLGERATAGIERLDFVLEPARQQRLVRADRADRMHRRIDAEFSLYLLLNVAGHEAAVVGGEEVGLAEEELDGDAGLVQRPEDEQVVGVRRRGGVEQDDAQVAARQVGVGLGAAGGGQRADARRVHPDHPFP